AAPAGAAIRVGVAALAPLGGVAAEAAGAGLPGHARIAVVAAERDEHFVVRVDAALQRARVAHAVVGARCAVALAVVGLEARRIAVAEGAALGLVQTLDAQVTREPDAHQARAAGSERAEGGRDGRLGVPLHVRRITQSVVVDGAELERALRRIGVVERERRAEAQLRRVVVLRGDRNGRRRFGDAGARVVHRAATPGRDS